jgi:heptosyltransferase-1
MPDVLFIKTSSLGDVIHHMPAVVDACKARPETAFAWLVEEAFAPLVRLHPAVSYVIPVAWRRWRKSLCAPSTMSEITASLRAIRDLHFDGVVGTQEPAFRLIARARDDATATTHPASASHWLRIYDKRYRISRDCIVGATAF